MHIVIVMFNKKHQFTQFIELLKNSPYTLACTPYPAFLPAPSNRKH